MLSFGFMIVMLIFLLILTHIAGRRWEAEGRYRTLDTRKGV
jgi:hypothetical protein